MSLPRGALPAVEYFVSSQSFSEVEEAKTLLQALAERVIQEMRDRTSVGRSRWNISDPGRDPLEEREFLRVASDLQQSIAEFKGTAHELALVREYLWLLSWKNQPERFLEVYLSTLYPHPTDDLVGLFADKALRAGRLLGREPEVLKAFDYVNSIPLEFAGKGRILAALASPQSAPHSDHFPFQPGS